MASKWCVYRDAHDPDWWHLAKYQPSRIGGVNRTAVMLSGHIDMLCEYPDLRAAVDQNADATIIEIERPTLRLMAYEREEMLDWMSEKEKEQLEKDEARVAAEVKSCQS